VEGLCTNVAIAQRLGLESVEDLEGLSDDHEIWEMIGYYLGIMCANLTLTLSLEKIVLGGGVLMRGEVLMQKIR
jgi:fructokinase